MTPTPNTPANAGKAIADIARDAAELVLKAVVAAPLASHYPSIQIEIIGSIADAIAKAIERDRAERDAAMESFERVCREDVDTNAARAERLQVQLAEREAELAAERVRIETQGHNVRFYADKSLALEAKLAEQSAALDVANEALNRIAAYDAPDAHAMIQQAKLAIAQIEALAGGRNNL